MRYRPPVSRAHKIANLAGIVLPFVGLVIAVALWDTWLHPVDVVLLVAGYLLTGIGVTVGYHRLFTHRAFQTKQWVRWTFAILGSMAVEGRCSRGSRTIASTISSRTWRATRTAPT